MNMEPVLKKCKTKDCQNVLPESGKERYCPDCQAARAERRRKRGEKVVDLLCAPGIVAMSIATRGNRNYNQKK